MLYFSLYLRVSVYLVHTCASQRRTVCLLVGLSCISPCISLYLYGTYKECHQNKCIPNTLNSCVLHVRGLKELYVVYEH